MTLKRIELTPEELRELLPQIDREIGVNARLPQEPYPGHPCNYPTCSLPTNDNIGCDAFKRCDTPGEGPYHVPFINKRGVKTSCHCRHWMYKWKNNRNNVPVDDPYLFCSESKKVDGQMRTTYYKVEIPNARNPYSRAIEHHGDRREENTPQPVGGKGDRKGRSGVPGDAETPR